MGHPQHTFSPLQTRLQSSIDWLPVSISPPQNHKLEKQAHSRHNAPPIRCALGDRTTCCCREEGIDLWMALRDRMKVNWAELTLQEKKAAYYIAFGAHAQAPPNEGWKVFGYVCAGIGATFVLFAGIRGFAKGSPSTMNKEYQEATNEYLKAQNSEPISGISSEGSSGPGMVQSAPKKN